MAKVTARITRMRLNLQAVVSLGLFLKHEIIPGNLGNYNVNPSDFFVQSF